MTESTSHTAVSAGESGAGLAARFLSRVQERLPDGPTDAADAWVAQAPAALDVMGGIAEHAGAMTLSTPTKRGVRVAAFPRDDQHVRVINLLDAGDAHRGNGRPGEVDWPLARFYRDDGVAADGDTIRARAAEVRCQVKLAALAAVYVLLESKLAPHLGGGFTLVIDADVPGACDGPFRACVQAATLAAVSRALALEVDDQRHARLAQHAHRAVFAWPAGIATHAGPLLGAPRRLLQVGCRSFDVGELPIPAGATFVGIDSGARHPEADAKHLHARTAALMGAEIIRRVFDAAGAASAWDGYLAHVSVTDYVDRLRDRLPTKLKGAAYLERFGPLADALAPIDPRAVYKVRSRAEHHIYEDDRVRQFAERLARVARTGDSHTLAEAGELMYASHWSYGQRCGLGSIETDLLVNLLRREGSDCGVLGARISGPGAGGAVVALLRDAPEAFDAVDRAIHAYQQRTGKVATLLAIADKGARGVTVERCS